jgi:hypothetical protein
MREISEKEAEALMGDTRDCPVLSQEENGETESAVALRRFPSCLVLGVSSDLADTFKLYAFDDADEARAAYDRFVTVMRETGTPFGPLS